MEKEKPYRCETCGKRYKNLNGLKYHRQHSPPCNPDVRGQGGIGGLPGGMMNLPNIQGDQVADASLI
jgi:transcription factor SFP1